jgi:hypothetical protein
MPYPWQSADHDASISAERDPADHDQVVVEIVIGDHASARITMWAHTFEQMAKEVLRD